MDMKLKNNIETASASFARGDEFDFNTMSKQLIAMKEMTEDGIVNSFGIPDYKDLTDEKTLMDLDIDVVQGDEIVNPEYAQVGTLQITGVNGEAVDANDLDEKMNDIIDTFNSINGKEATAFKVALSNALTAQKDESLANEIRGPTM